MSYAVRHPNDHIQPERPRQDPNSSDGMSPHPHCNRDVQRAKRAATDHVKRNPGGLAMEPAPQMAYIPTNPTTLPA